MVVKSSEKSDTLSYLYLLKLNGDSTKEVILATTKSLSSSPSSILLRVKPITYFNHNRILSGLNSAADLATKIWYSF